ncbi:unnamed protein product [Somion occarium]|uniref:F-box domain-containing protein n=1 Tax=Somion occarium TaxID=3059160 RepID=A0ABP1CU22_9APHY
MLLNNSDRPIPQTLPGEVLARIFALAEPKYEDFGVFPGNFEYYRHFAWVEDMSLICCHWRNTFVLSPELWTTIIWRPPRKKFIRAALARSGNHPLRVYALSSMEDEGSPEWDVERDEDEKLDAAASSDLYKMQPRISYLIRYKDWDPPNPPVMSRNYYDPEDFFKDIAQHIRRVKTFHLTLPGVQLRMLLKIFTTAAPQLET